MMMKIKKLLLIISGLFLGIVSCNNDVNDVNVLADISADQAEFTLSAKYKGILYEVPGKLDDEGNPVYLNKEFNDLYQKELSKHPTLVTVLTGENVVEHYESLNDVFEEKDLKIIEQMSDSNVSGDVTTRAATSGNSGLVSVWDDTNYEDRRLDFPITYTSWWAISHLSDYNNFNDKISSLKIWSYIDMFATVIDAYENSYPGSDLRITFVGYENNSYSGQVLLCLCPPGFEHFDPKLKNFGWNDKITALKVLITSMNNGAGNLNNPYGTAGYPSITPYSQH
jgi:hypothetical protein